MVSRTAEARSDKTQNHKARGGLTPPVLTGGFGPRNPGFSGRNVKGKSGNRRAASVGVDFLTVSAVGEASAWLLGATELVEGYGSGDGWRTRERRVGIAGEAWRRAGPSQPIGGRLSYAGAEYESWEFAAGVAGYYTRQLRERDLAKYCRPSRVDVAFDFDLMEGEDLRSEDVVRLVMADLVEREITVEFAGSPEDVTMYVGSKHSDVRLRIYRRDLKNALLVDTVGRQLRIELVLKKKPAERWWMSHALGETEREAHLVGGFYVERLLGLDVLDGACNPRDLDYEDPEIKAAQRLFEWTKQNASMLLIAKGHGFNIFTIADQLAERWAKQTRHEHKKRGKVFKGRDPEVVEAEVFRLVHKLKRPIDA